MTLKTKNNLLQSLKLKTVMVLLPHKYGFSWTQHGLPWWLSGKETTCQSRRHKTTWVWSLGWEYPIEEEMATGSSIFAWKIPWTEEPGGLQFMQFQESDTTESGVCAHTHSRYIMWVLYVSTSGRATCHFQKRKVSLREIKLCKDAQGESGTAGCQTQICHQRPLPTT